MVAIPGAVQVLLTVLLALLYVCCTCKCFLHTLMYVDSHDSGYLGMAVQLYVQAHLVYVYIVNNSIMYSQIGLSFNLLRP